jgi:hypothetical protein
MFNSTLRKGRTLKGKLCAKRIQNKGNLKGKTKKVGGSITDFLNAAILECLTLRFGREYFMS